MRIGDKVRFLSEIGGGIVVGFDKKGWALVEDSDGFQVPMPPRECVVVEENVIGKDANTKYLQTKNGDDLYISLVYTKADDKSNMLFNCIIANESNYNLLFTYNLDHKEQQICVFAGEVLPYQKKTIFSFDKDALNFNSKRVSIKAIPFKRFEPGNVLDINNKLKQVDSKRAYETKASIEKTFVLDPINLLKDSSFKENEYISSRAYVVPIIKKDELILIQTAESKQELLDKFNADVKEIKVLQPKVTKALEDDNAIFRINSLGIIEVDLHASELLDTTSGMGSKEILQYQLQKFNDIMVENLNKRGCKIVFIHGKGDGVLRNSIIKEIKNKYSKCTYQDASFKEYGFGATMVTIKF